MALDRTWYNALVDDDGSNAVGTVWNKFQIDALLDSVDTEVNRLGKRIPWTPTVHLENGTQLSAGVQAAYHVAGDMLHFSLYIINISVPAGASGVLLIPNPPGYTPVPGRENLDETVVRTNNGTTFWGYLRTRDASWLECRLENNGAWVAGVSAIVGQGSFYFR